MNALHVSIINIFIAVIFIMIIDVEAIDDYTVADGNKSLLVALGCFWCAEQAFEQYAPGVVEVISGYAGENGIENPTYRNHPGHYEVILIEYDPSKTSYEVLVNYAYRNMDPFDGNGQFCDRGSSYYPAIFYENDEERDIALNVTKEILDLYPTWMEDDIKAPILQRPTFWTAEEYHQDYYIKNPSNYGYYKNGCRRPQRLKEVWGEEQYYCYHDESYSCFNETVVNTDGDQVDPEFNVKNAPEEVVGLLPSWAVALLCVLGGLILIAILLFIISRYCQGERTKVK